MLMVTIPDRQQEISNPEDIERFLAERGILRKYFNLPEKMQDKDDACLLETYRPLAEPHLEINSVDVLRVTEDTPNLDQLREVFNKEHTHSEDEIRFLLIGDGTFWIHGEAEIFSLNIEAGDLIRLPAGIRHWFTFKSPPLVALRFYTNREGWVGHFTGSGIEQKYRPH